MQRSLVFKIFLGIVFLILVCSILFNILYFNNFHKNIRHITEKEKSDVINILNNSVDLQNYQIIVGNVYSVKSQEFVPVDLKNGRIKKHYLVDLTEGKIQIRPHGF